MPKAAVCRELGPPESLRLEPFAAGPLAPGQVRVAIRAAGINFPDILMVAGEYQLKPPLPFTPGVEAAGDVVEVNEAPGRNQPLNLREAHFALLRMRTENQTKGNP